MSGARGIAIRRDDTRRMEDEAKQMEAKLELLRRTMDQTEKPAPKGADGGRWRSGAASKPITKGYVKSVMEAPRAKPKGTASQRVPSTGARATVDGTPRKEGAVGDLLGFAGNPAAGSPNPSRAGGTAAANLQAAMLQQDKDAMEVEGFLGSLKLDRYVSLFMEHGFDCMEVVKDMQESHMQDIGMAAGHVLKLKKCLAEMNPAPAAPAQADLSSSGRKVTFGSAEQTMIPAAPPKSTANQGNSSGKLSDGAFDEEESAASFQEALRAWREGGSSEKAAAASSNKHSEGSSSNKLSDGAFDEEESAASFQEALRAWREGGSTAKPASCAEQENGNAEKPKAAAGSFWTSLGESEVNLERASTPLKLPSELQSTETQRDPCPSEEKLCCYQCYKQFYAQYCVERHSPLPEVNGGGTKRLCSEACADKWMSAVQAKAEAFEQRQAKLREMMDMQRSLASEKATADSNEEQG